MSPAAPYELGRNAAIVLLACTAASPALAQAIAPATTAPPSGTFRAEEAFTFLFLAIGPAHAIPAFAAMTAGRERAYKVRLAAYGGAAAALAILLAGTVGVSFLQKWHLSMSALALAAGLLLLLVALGKLLGGQKEAHTAPATDAPPPRPIDLAFSPLAVPTIIPPFGMAVVILLLALAQQRGATGTMAVLILIMLALDVLAMIFADRIVKVAVLRYALTLLGTMIGVLQVALAVQTIANAIRELNVF